MYTYFFVLVFISLIFETTAEKQPSPCV